MARSNKSTSKKTTKSVGKFLATILLIVVLLIIDFVSTKLPMNSENTSEQRVSIVESLFQSFFGTSDDLEQDSSDENDESSVEPEGTTESSGINIETNNSNASNNTTSTEYTDERLVVYFFDVGQADSILLMQGDKVMLVDTGNAGDAQNTEKLVEGNINLTRELKRLGIDVIDILVLTHSHEDHMGSSYKIINNFEVVDLYANALLEESEQPNYYERFVKALSENDVHFISPTTLTEREIIAKIDEYNTALIENASNTENSGEEDFEVELLEYNPEDYIRVGDTIDFGTARITMIAPNSSEYSDINDTSIVLMVEFEGVKLLLTGDAGKESEEEILAYAEATGFDLDCDVLKVGHHGSRTANTEEFISAVRPEYAIVMVSEGNSYGLPDEDVIERLENHNAVVYETRNTGDIVLIIDNGTYEFDFSYSHEEKPED